MLNRRLSFAKSTDAACDRHTGVCVCVGGHLLGIQRLIDSFLSLLTCGQTDISDMRRTNYYVTHLWVCSPFFWTSIHTFSMSCRVQRMNITIGTAFNVQNHTLSLWVYSLCSHNGGEFLLAINLGSLFGFFSRSLSPTITYSCNSIKRVSSKTCVRVFWRSENHWFLLFFNTSLPFINLW